jgi:uncharacterized protein (TIGR02145 family)
MSLKTIFCILFLFCTMALTHAQTKEKLAQVSMQAAEEAFSAEKYTECFFYLKEVETNLGKTNSRVQYLKVKALINTAKWKEAETELKLFFDITPENEPSAEKYEEMVVAVRKIKKIIEEIELRKKEEETNARNAALEAEKKVRLEEEEYKRALDLKTLHGYAHYLEKYPNGKYKAEADEKISVKIGTQVWMRSNLDVDHYSNGDIIPEEKDQKGWVNLNTGARCYYNNDPSLGVEYGNLYNWYAVTDKRGLCPAGWHVPSDAEWLTLTTFLGGGPPNGIGLIDVAGGKLKEAGTDHWRSPNKEADNSSGFTGLPGGFLGAQSVNNTNRNYDFRYMGSFGYWWSTTESSPETAYYIELIFSLSKAKREYFKDGFKQQGLSVRCLRD